MKRRDFLSLLGITAATFVVPVSSSEDTRIHNVAVDLTHVTHHVTSLGVVVVVFALPAVAGQRMVAQFQPSAVMRTTGLATACEPGEVVVDRLGVGPINCLVRPMDAYIINPRQMGIGMSPVDAPISRPGDPLVLGYRPHYDGEFLVALAVQRVPEVPPDWDGCPPIGSGFAG